MLPEAKSVDQNRKTIYIANLQNYFRTKYVLKSRRFRVLLNLQILLLELTQDLNRTKLGTPLPLLQK
jgi:hypothetical protein